MSPVRAGAEERLRRLLALVPWVASQDGAPVAEVCARFGCSEDELLADLDQLFVCGVHPFTPDTLIEVEVDEGRVWIRYADWFARPLRLTPAEGLALVVAGSALLAVPPSDPDGPLARALAKLAVVLGIDPDEAVDVELGAAPPEVLATVRRGVAEHRQVEVDYYSYGRDAWTLRVVDPHHVYSAAGQWYLAGWCHRAGAGRIFRVDRMRGATLLDSSFEPPAPSAPPPLYSPRAEDPVVVLELAAEDAWVAEQYPHEGVERLHGGRLRVRLRVSEQAWLERLLLRLGADSRVAVGDDEAGPRAARRVLSRYRASVA